MTRLSILLGVLLLLGTDVLAQGAPKPIASRADDYTISVEYRTTPTGRNATRELHLARVTLTPTSSRTRPLWRGDFLGLRIYPGHRASPQAGAVRMTKQRNGSYVGFAMVPAPGSMRGLAFAGSRGVSNGFLLPEANPYDDPDDTTEPEPEPDAPGPGTVPPNPQPTPPGDEEPPEDDWPIVDPWEEDPPSENPGKPAPNWPDDMGDDLENPWEVFSSGGRVFIVR